MNHFPLPPGASHPTFYAGSMVGGRYELQQPLGSGRLGQLWKAQDTRLGLTVAVRILHPEVDAEVASVVVGRLLALTHPNILRVYDTVAAPEATAIVQEYCAGRSLEFLMNERGSSAFPFSEVEGWALDLFSALRFGMEHAGCVHGAVQLKNLHIGTDGKLKIADYGMIPLSRWVPEVRNTESHSHRTLSTLSPQRLESDNTPPQLSDDVYAAAACIYELLTGKPVFHEGNVVAQITFKVPPSITERRAELGQPKSPIPQRWEIFLAKCLSKDSHVRPVTESDFAQLTEVGGAKNIAPGHSSASAGNPVQSIWNRSAGGSRSFLTNPFVWSSLILVLLALATYVLMWKPRQNALDERGSAIARLDQGDRDQAADPRARMAAWEDYFQRYAASPVSFTEQDDAWVLQAGQKIQQWQRELERTARESAEKQKQEEALTAKFSKALIALKETDNTKPDPAERASAWAALQKEFATAGHPTGKSYEMFLQEAAASKSRWELKAAEEATRAEATKKAAVEQASMQKSEAETWKADKTKLWELVVAFCKDEKSESNAKVERLDSFLASLANPPAAVGEVAEQYKKGATELREQLISYAEKDTPEAPLSIAELMANSPAQGQSEKVQAGLLMRAQEILKAKGFYQDTPDGVHGKNSHAALLAFQRSSKILPTGQLDAATLKSLGLENVDLTQLPEKPKTSEVAEKKTTTPKRRRAAEPAEEPSVWSKIGKGFKNAFTKDSPAPSKKR